MTRVASFFFFFFFFFAFAVVMAAAVSTVASESTASPNAPASFPKPRVQKTCSAPALFLDTVIGAADVVDIGGDSAAVVATCFASFNDSNTNKTSRKTVIYYASCDDVSDSSSSMSKHQEEHNRFLQLRGKKPMANNKKQSTSASGTAIIFAASLYDSSVFFAPPVVVHSNSSTKQLSAAYNSVAIIAFLYTVPDSAFGRAIIFARLGAVTLLAVDVRTGTAFFTSGSFNGVEHIGALVIKGDSTAPRWSWLNAVTTGGANFTSQLGPPLFIASTLFFSSKGTLVALTAANGKEIATTDTPCGFKSLEVKGVAFDMFLYAIDENRAAALVLIAESTFGMCIVDATTGKPQSATGGATIKNATFIVAVVGAGGVVLVDHYSTALLGYLSAFSSSTGSLLWSARRDNAAASIILPLPVGSTSSSSSASSTHFAANTDVPGGWWNSISNKYEEYAEAFGLVDLRTGKMTKQCLFVAALGTTVWDAANNRALVIATMYDPEDPELAKSIFAIDFTAGCHVVWATTVSEYPVSFSRAGALFGGGLFVEVVLSNGDSVSISVAAQ